MRKSNPIPLVTFILFSLLAPLWSTQCLAQASPNELSLAERLRQRITLDASGMNIVDILHYLAKKGDFNTVISPEISGKSTAYLNNVTIEDALRSIASTNHLGYRIDNNIINIMPESQYQALYGKEFNNKTVVEIIHLNYLKPSFVLSALDGVRSNIGKIVIDEDAGSVTLIDTPQALSRMKETLERLDQPLENQTYTILYADAEKVAEKLRTKIDAKGLGSINVDTRTNQIIARTLPGRQDEIRQLIRTLDVERKQVRVDMQMLQVTLEPTHNIGIDWALVLKNSSDKQKFVVKSSLANSNTATTFNQLGVGTIDASEFAAKLKALDGVSNSKIISAPTIVTANGQEASVHIGDSVPYVAATRTGTGENTFITENVRFVDVGITLKVTPSISSSGMIAMQVKPEMSTVVATLSSISGGIPQINRTEVSTAIQVENKKTAVLSGLRQVHKFHSKKGIPKLMKLPIAGTLGSYTSDTPETIETIIFITPTIIGPNVDVERHPGSLKPSKMID